MDTSKITEIIDQKNWTILFNSLKSPSFLQSWEWGELQKKLGYSVLRLSIELHKVIGIAQCIIIRSKRGNFLFVPHGPILDVQSTKEASSIMSDFVHYVVKVAKKEKLDFVRISPILEGSQENNKIFDELGFRKAPLYMHAERVWQMSITPDEEQLLREMRKTTRYSIKRAEKLGVRIEIYPSEEDILGGKDGRDPDEMSNERGESNREMRISTGRKYLTESNISSKKQAIDQFWSIYQTTAKREGFVPFSKSYLINEFESFNKTGNAFFVFAYEEGSRLTAAALIVCTKSCAFYHQGATLHSKVPSAYLLQWRSIQEAKKRGCTLYNFWGTYKKGRTPNDWKGLSLFKEGFGGFATDYVETQDRPITIKYWWTVFYETLLKLKRFHL